jgi:hypothetical protein
LRIFNLVCRSASGRFYTAFLDWLYAAGPEEIQTDLKINI